MNRNAPSPVFTERLSPAGLFGREIEHRQEARLVPEQLPPVFIGVAACRNCELVDERLGEKCVQRVIDTAPESPGHMCFALGEHDALVVDCIGDMRRFLGVVLVDVMVVPRVRITVRIESTAETADARLAVIIVPRILLARPDQLYRVWHLTRQARSLDRVIREQATAETTAEVLVVQSHVPDVHFEHIGDLFRVTQRILRPGPQLAPAIMYPGRAIHRFHR